jgi:hypothetical protein
LTRYRVRLTEEKAREVNRVQKTLEDCAFTHNIAAVGGITLPQTAPFLLSRERGRE